MHGRRETSSRRTQRIAGDGTSSSGADHMKSTLGHLRGGRTANQSEHARSEQMSVLDMLSYRNEIQVGTTPLPRGVEKKSAVCSGGLGNVSGEGHGSEQARAVLTKAVGALDQIVGGQNKMVAAPSSWPQATNAVPRCAPPKGGVGPTVKRLQDAGGEVVQNGGRHRQGARGR